MITIINVSDARGTLVVQGGMGKRCFILFFLSFSSCHFFLFGVFI